MKTYLIKASAPGPFKDYKKAMGAPPQNIFSVAATTPDHVLVTLCDETIGMKPNLKTDADVVALFFHTPDAVHAYALADKFRQRGKTVVMGGLHASFLPEEAAEHADALLIGEAEGIWEELLEDVAANRLRPIYRRKGPVDLATLNPWPTDLIAPAKYDYFWAVMVSRGCPHRCDFCTVPEFFDGKYRWRPVDQVVAEIKNIPDGCWVELHADNLTANRKYALELFEALTPLKINWIGEATIKMADDEELLKAAANSGCKGLLVGVETSSKSALGDSGKDFVAPEIVREKIRRFHAHGIEVTSSMIFGFDSHSQDIFQESVEFCRNIEIDEVEAVILIPFPGTPLYRRLDDEGRILSNDWSQYDGSHATFKPQNMTAEELEEGTEWFWNEIRKRKPASSRKSSTNSQRSGREGPRLVGESRTKFKWKSTLALIGIGVAMVFNFYWIWGILFLIWGLTDLYNGDTYLLDDLPRSESPVLYWLVVSMWIGLGVWALGFAPGSLKEQWTAQAMPQTTWHEGSVVETTVMPVPKAKTILVSTAPVQEATIVSKSDEGQFNRNKHLDYMVITPQPWSAEEQVEPQYVALNLQDSQETVGVTILTMDLGGRISLDDFINEMESDLAVTIPAVNPKAMTAIEPQANFEVSGLTMEGREYLGEHEGYPVISRVYYGVGNRRGYVLIGMFSRNDKQARSDVLQVMDSFALTNKK